MKRLLALVLFLTLTIFSFADSAAEVRDQMIGSSASPIATPDQSQTTINPQDQAERILANPLYREQIDTQEGESWLSTALENLFNRIGEWLSNLFRNRQEPNGSSLQAAAGLTEVMIVVLLAILAAFIIYMLAQIRFKKKNDNPETDSLVTDAEAGRNADQWLTEADKLAASGDFRAAIRCLYIASLVRMDEARLLRFERHETNWEHLYRFRDLPNKPGEFHLEPLTLRFDQAWYGFVPQSQSDVDWFKSEYRSLLTGIKGISQ